jgi:eukaryotic-like serine/threonine-protein kinase
MELEFQPGTLLLEKFKVLRLLGEGGLGAVYEVEHVFTKHRRAMKVLHARHRSNTDVVERFLREASAAGRIGNSHIVETFDAGLFADGSPYLIMEFLRGESLADYLRYQGRLSIAEMVNIIEQCCQGLAAAHSAHIIHRDLKPDNLFIEKRGDTQFVKILDFGVSKFSSQIADIKTMTQDGNAIGTPVYMAPEQMRGTKDLDARADIYSMGLVAYECLAGGVPFDAQSFAELASQVLGGKGTPLESYRPDLPAALLSVIKNATAIDANQRPASMNEFRAQLLPFASVVTNFATPAPNRTSDTITPGGSEPLLLGTAQRIDTAPLADANANSDAKTQQDGSDRETAALAKQKKPSQKRWWLLAILAIGLAGKRYSCSLNEKKATTEQPAEMKLKIITPSQTLEFRIDQVTDAGADAGIVDAGIADAGIPDAAIIDAGNAVKIKKPKKTGIIEKLGNE